MIATPERIDALRRHLERAQEVERRLPNSINRGRTDAAALRLSVAYYPGDVMPFAVVTPRTATLCGIPAPMNHPSL